MNKGMDNERIPRVMVRISISTEFGQGLLLGISKYLSIHRPWVVWRKFGSADRVQSKYELEAWKPDGAISDGLTINKLKTMATKGMPAIFVNKSGHVFLKFFQ